MFKRFNHIGGSYFITSITKFRIPFFMDPGCCRVFIEVLRIAKKLYNFDLYSFIVMPDHVHLIIYPKGNKNISQIMHYIKRNCAREINDILKGALQPVVFVTKDNYPWLQKPQGRAEPWTSEIKEHHDRLKNIQIQSESLFEWQPSFHDRLLRNNQEFQSAIDYINIKNLNDLNTKYHLLTKSKLKDYHFYTYTNSDLIDEY